MDIENLTPDGADQPLLEVLARLETAGYVNQFAPLGGGMVRCVSCGGELPAKGLIVDQQIRLEGASDPDDMLIVFGIRCAVCGYPGTLVLHYGPEASADEADVLLHLT